MIVCLGLLAAFCAGCATGETGSPSDVSERGATVGGRVASSVGGSVEYWVRYGPTTAYGSETAHASVAAVKNVPRAVTGIAIAGLARSTTYHYQLCARDSQQSGGPGCGADRTLTTQSFACGETITASVRLTGDRFCDSAAGLVVGAPGIDVNLAGHALGGPIFSGGGGPPGILNSAGHPDVTIRNGSLGGWGNAIHLQGASRNRILDVAARGAGAGVWLEGGDANEIRASDVFGRGLGIFAEGSDRLVVATTRADGAFGPGVRIEGDLANVVRNQVPHLGGFQVVSGVEVTGSGNRIVGNRVSGNWTAGGIAIRAGADNVVAENEVSDGAILALDPPLDSFGDGIFVGAFTAGTLLRDNLAQGNKGDGIEVRAAVTRLRGNVASSNGDFGIDAAAGVTDLGGNRASSNGNPAQCRNVLCE